MARFTINPEKFRELFLEWFESYYGLPHGGPHLVSFYGGLIRAKLTDWFQQKTGLLLEETQSDLVFEKRWTIDVPDHLAVEAKLTWG